MQSSSLNMFQGDGSQASRETQSWIVKLARAWKKIYIYFKGGRERLYNDRFKVNVRNGTSGTGVRKKSAWSLANLWGVLRSSWSGHRHSYHCGHLNSSVAPRGPGSSHSCGLNYCFQQHCSGFAVLMTSIPPMPFLFSYQMTIFWYIPSCVLHTEHSELKVTVMFIHHGLPLPLNIRSHVRCGQSSCLEITDLPLCLCHKVKSESKERGERSGKTKK